MSSNVVDLLNRKEIYFIEKGNDALVCCLSAEHTDSSPSMRIDKTTGKYNCFSCGFGGQNIFEYFNEYYNPVSRQAAELRIKISNIVMDLTGIELPSGAEFYLGDYRGIPPKVYQKFRAFQHPDFDDRLCFPITNLSGKITNIVARNFHSTVPPKYKMYPEGRSVPIYPSVVGRHVVLVEGIFDVLNLEKYGMVNVASLFGTQSMSERNIVDKITPLMLGGIQDIFLLLDNDKAGNSAAAYLKKIIEIKTNIVVHILNDYLPVGKDPGELEEQEVTALITEINKVLY
jgi:DNA primase